MPKRKTPLVTGQYYHVFNRGINKQPIFFTPRNYERATETMKFYLVHKPSIRYSKFIKLPKEIKEDVSKSLEKSKKCVELISYVLMPNHYHFLLRQIEENGTREFVKNFQISYTRYINIRFDRSGPILQGQFKAVLIEDDEQLLHVSRYIHLNPYTSFVVRDFEELKSYPWSSLPEFLTREKVGMCSTNNILAFFKEAGKYLEFVINQAEYQKELNRIKHLTLE